MCDIVIEPNFVNLNFFLPNTVPNIFVKFWELKCDIVIESQ